MMDEADRKLARGFWFFWGGISASVLSTFTPWWGIVIAVTFWFVVDIIRFSISAKKFIKRQNNG